MEMERVNGIAPLSRPWHGRMLLLNHTRKTGVPSRTLTSNLTLSPSTPRCRASPRANPEQEGASLRVEWVRTRPLYALSYGDKDWYARPVTLRNPALI